TIGHIGSWHLDLRSVSLVEPNAWGDLSSILVGSNTDRVSLAELLPRQLKLMNQESLA
ncbi:MAG: hypothetical protein RLZZ339_1038, partial [Cyanobacteriota bacterium]